VLAQSEPDFRVLVSDDASDEPIARRVEAHVAGLGDPRVGYRRHPDNLMEFAHGRFLFSQCEEEFFAVLHDDDLWEPTFLERCLEVLRRDPALACVTTDQAIIDSRGDANPRETAAYRRRMGRDRHPEGRLRILEPLLDHSLFALSSSVFRTAALEGSGLVDEGLQGNAIFDINLFLRLGERDECAWYLPEPLAAYRVHEDRLTESEERGGLNGRLLENFMAVLEARRFSGSAERERRRQLSAAYHNYAVIRYLQGDVRGFRRFLKKCVATSPWRLQSWAYFSFAALPFLVRPIFGSRVAGEPGR
jgi:glycosyltransferase involved in cell wall biosynthesis